MEFAIAHLCYANKVLFIAVRFISDNEDNSGEDNFDECIELVGV